MMGLANGLLKSGYLPCPCCGNDKPFVEGGALSIVYFAFRPHRSFLPRKHREYILDGGLLLVPFFKLHEVKVADLELDNADTLRSYYGLS